MDNTHQMISNRATEDEYRIDTVTINNQQLVSLLINGEERVCLAQLSGTLLKDYTYNEIHNRRVALGITCVQCTPFQLEILRKARAMPTTSRRCGMITTREAERLYKSFFKIQTPPQLPVDFGFNIYHKCGWGCSGYFIPSRYNSSRAKCIKCAHCGSMFSPNKFIFHCHQLPGAEYTHADAANFNSWRRHIQLTPQGSKEIEHSWEDVKAMFNGGSRKRLAPAADDTMNEMPSKLLNDMRSSPSLVTSSPACSILSQSVPPRFRLPSASPIHAFPPGFPSSFLRPPVADPTLQPMWQMQHSVAFNELLMHRSRLLAPHAASLAPYRHQLSTTAQNLSLNASGKNQASAASSPIKVEQPSSTVLDEIEEVEIKNEAKGKKIKRPWIDTESQVNTQASLPAQSSLTSSNSVLGQATSLPLTPKLEQHSQALLLREFLQRMEHSVLL